MWDEADPKTKKTRGESGSAALMPKVWPQKTIGVYTGDHPEDHRAYSPRAHSGDREEGAETTNPAHGQDRVPKVWKQPSLCLAGANQGKRRILNTVFQMHKVQLHLPRIQLNWP